MLPRSVRVEYEHVFVLDKYKQDDFEAVKRLARAGESDYTIARELGFPRSTVQRYRHLNALPARHPRARRTVPLCWRPENGKAYAYLLGAYLGDGHIWQASRACWRLTVSLDRRYPLVVDEVQAAIEAADPTTTVRRHHYRPGAKLLVACSLIWPIAFPQHGPGRKHERPIVLADWQREITHEHPQALIRGLIHSDGSRCINRFKTQLPSGRVAEYAYPRYFFTNVSDDIRGIFTEHCELLGIRWTQSNWKNISVSHRDSVALLDAFVGPKA